MTTLRRIISITLFLLSMIARAESIHLPEIFADGMVLQREIPTRLWGTAEADTSLQFSIDNRILASSKTDSKGNWEVLLPAQVAGGPYQLTINSENEEKHFKDVWFGDVWVASGQSNMEWKLSWEVNNWEREVEDSNYPQIRFFNVPNDFSPEKQSNFNQKSEWQVAGPETSGDFSAIAWFFAKHNHLEKGVPVGIIDSSWGGTPAEAWTPKEQLRHLPYYDTMINQNQHSVEKWEQIISDNNEANTKKWELIENNEKALKQGVHLPKFNDQKWEIIQLPNTEPFSDICWFRKTFELESVPETTSIANIGQVFQILTVFINGECVYHKRPEEKLLPFEIDSALLRKGTNTIAMRVINDWNNQVTIGKTDQFHISINETTLDLHGNWKFSNTMEPKIPVVDFLHWTPGFIYNAMIHPIEGYSIKGVIWYQGENNAEEWKEYETLFGTLIDSWRIQWKQGNFPFLFTQLANYMAKQDQPVESDWAALRETQRLNLAKDNTGMAVTLDIGDADDVHPRNKQEVGYRLWLAAKKVAFKEDVIDSGPVLDSWKRINNKVILKFASIADGIVAKQPLEQCFSLVDSDGNSMWTSAKVIGTDQIQVTIPLGVTAVELRYAWADNPNANLFNSENLPASSFRIVLK